MSVLIDTSTKVICQGFTGQDGTFQSEGAHRLRHQDGRRRFAGQKAAAGIGCRWSDTVKDAAREKKTGADAP